MSTMSIRVEEEWIERLDKLVEENSLNKSSLMRKVMIEMIEELEDFYKITKRLANPYKTYSLEEVKSELEG